MNPGDAPLFSPAVYTIWWAGLVLSLIVFVPRSVYLLHRTRRAARSIEVYAADALKAAAGIAGNTQHIVALDDTIVTATRMLGSAKAAERKLSTIADVLAGRAQ